MELSNADYYAFAESQGLPAPTNAEMKAQLTPYVREWKQRQLEGQREDRGPNALGLGLGALGVGGIGAALLALHNRNKRAGMDDAAASQAAAQELTAATGGARVQPLPVKPPSLQPVERKKPILRPLMKGQGNTLRGTADGSYKVNSLLSDPDLGPRLVNAITPEDRRALIDYTAENHPDKLSQVIDAIDVRKGGSEMIELPVGYPVPDGVAAGTAVQRTTEVDVEVDGEYKTITVPVGELEVVVPSGRKLTTVAAGPDAMISRLGQLEETFAPADIPDDEGSNRGTGLVPVGKKGGASSQIGYDPEAQSYLTTSVPELVVVKDQAGRPVIVTESSLKDPFIQQQVQAAYPKLGSGNFIEVGSAADWNRLDPTLDIATRGKFGVSDVARALLPAEYAGDEQAYAAFKQAYSRNQPDRFLANSNQRLAVVVDPMSGYPGYVSKESLDRLRPEVLQFYGTPAESDFWYPVYDMGGGETGEPLDPISLANKVLGPHIMDGKSRFLREKFTGENPDYPGIYDLALEEIESRRIEGVEERTDDGGGLVNGGAAVGGAKPYEQSWLMHEGGQAEGATGLVPPPWDLVGTQVRTGPEGLNPAGQHSPSSSTAGAIRALAYAPDANLSLVHQLVTAPFDPEAELRAKMAVLADPKRAELFQSERQKLVDLGIKQADGSYVTVDPQQAESLALRSLAPTFAVQELEGEIPPLMEFVKARTGYSGSAANLLGLTTEAMTAAARDYSKAIEWAREKDPELFKRTQPGNEGAITFEQFMKPYVRSYVLGKTLAESSGTGGSAAMYKVPESVGERLVHQMFQQGVPLEQVVAQAIQPRGDFARQPLASAEIDALRVSNPQAFAGSPFEAMLLLDQATSGALGRVGREPWTNASRLAERFVMEAPVDGGTEIGALKKQLAQTQLAEEGLRPGLSSYPVALRFSGPETAMKTEEEALDVLKRVREGGVKIMEDDSIVDEALPGQEKRVSRLGRAMFYSYPQYRGAKLNSNIDQEYGAYARMSKDIDDELADKSALTPAREAELRLQLDSLKGPMDQLVKEQAWLLENRDKVEDWLTSSNFISRDETGAIRPGSTGLSINSVNGQVMVAPDAFRSRGTPEAAVTKGATVDGDVDAGELLDWGQEQADALDVTPDKRVMKIDFDASDLPPEDQAPRWPVREASGPVRAPATFVQKPRMPQGQTFGRAVNLDQPSRSPLPVIELGAPTLVSPRGGGAPVDPSTIYYGFQRDLEASRAQPTLAMDLPARERLDDVSVTAGFDRPGTAAEVATLRQRNAADAMNRELRRRQQQGPLLPLPAMPKGYNAQPEEVGMAQVARGDSPLAAAAGDELRRRGYTDAVTVRSPRTAARVDFGGLQQGSASRGVNFDRDDLAPPGAIRGGDSVNFDFFGPDESVPGLRSALRERDPGRMEPQRSRTDDWNLMAEVASGADDAFAAAEQLRQRGFGTVLQLNSPYPGGRRGPMRFSR